MKKVCKLIAGILVVFLLAINTTAATAVPNAVIEATNSVVRILAEYREGYVTGSGFVVKSDIEETIIVTNYHVVEGNPYSISVWIEEEEAVSATIVGYTDQKDMCILKLAYPVSLKALPLAKEEAKQGAAVYAVGFPGAADFLSDKEAHISTDATITDGIVSAIRESTVSSYGTPTKILQINAAINSGNSGGPLFNANGEVVGINTYGINDSQGIFGAIDLSELTTFLMSQGISFESNKNDSFLWIVIAAMCLIVAGGIVVVLWVAKKTKKIKKTVSNISLRAYMETHPEGIGAENAVALLLPVALKLRDMHNDGKMHLQISPDSILLCEEGTIIKEPTNAESDRYTSGYASPEVYKGIHCGNLSDIYSFCAVLSYAAFGKHPQNALARSEEPNEEPSVFARIVNHGMAIEPEKRISSMQDVIIKISPFNLHPVTMEKIDQVKTEEKPKRKKKVSAILVAAIAITVVVIALLGTYFGCYLGASRHAENKEFTSAKELLFVPGITELHDPQLCKYVDAGLLLNSRQYDSATQAFASLTGFMEADTLCKEAQSRQAAQYADANDFAQAISIMTKLRDEGFADADAQIMDFQFRQGAYLLYEKKDYSKAIDVFMNLSHKGHSDAEAMWKESYYLWAMSLIEQNELKEAYGKLNKIKDYADVKDKLSALTELMYLEGQLLYRSGHYTEARDIFSYIQGYADSNKYLILIEVKKGYRFSSQIKELMNQFYFEDTAEVLLSSQYCAEEFLRGTWKGGGYYFKMNADGGTQYSLPWINYGDYYKIEDGTYLLYPKNNESKTKKQFTFEALSPDTLRVYCHKNGKSYTLYRQ